MPKTNTEKQADYRRRVKERGGRLMRLEVTPGDEPLLRECAALLRGEGREALTEWLKQRREEGGGRFVSAWTQSFAQTSLRARQGSA